MAWLSFTTYQRTVNNNVLPVIKQLLPIAILYLTSIYNIKDMKASRMDQHVMLYT